jgi:hypothetical protein
MSRKVFTAGEILAASDVNNFLMNQTVMSFAGTAERATAIPTPIEGMTTYNETTDILESWNGSAWVSPVVASGLIYIGSTSVSTATNILLDNIFTSDYDSYQIVYSVTHSATISSTFRFVNLDGTDNSTANYSGVIFAANGATPSTTIVYNNNAATSANAMMFEANESAGIMVVHNPRNVSNTRISGQGMCTNRIASIAGGRFNATTQFRGIRFTIASGNITGTFRVYGLRNA